MADFSKLKGLVLGVFLLLLSISLCLLVIESYFTIQYYKERERLENKKPGEFFCTMRSEFPELIYTRIPNKCGANSHGFRDHEYAYSKEEGVFRIAIIGDSVADGHGLELNRSFGKVLERQLNRLPEGEGQKVEVIVLAQGGYSTSQELFLLEHEAFKYSPDLVIWSYVLNDPAHPVYRGASGEVGDYYYRPRFHTVHFIFDKIFKIIEKIKAQGCETEYHALLHCAYWEQVETSIEKIAEISQQKHVPVIFLIHPIFEENGDYDSYFLAPLHARLSTAASESGLQVVDLLDAYRPYDPAELKLPSDLGHDLWHPNEEGHRIAAAALLSFIDENGYFP